MKRRYFEFIVIPVLFLLFVGILSFLFILPRQLEKNILPSLGNKFFNSVSGQVFSIGIHEASLGNVTLGDKKNSALRIGSIQAEYSLSSIKNKRIDQITINGLTLNLEISEGRIIIPGLKLEKNTASEIKEKKSQSSSPVTIDWQPDNFHITNGFINIVNENQRFIIPFDLQVSREEQLNTTNRNVYLLQLQINSPGGEISVTGTIDLASNNAVFALSADSLDIKPLVSLLGKEQKFLKAGKVAISSDAEIKLIPFQLLSSRTDCEFESLHLDHDQLAFGTPAGSADSDKPLRVKINSNGLQWDVTAHGSILTPLEASIALDGKLLAGNNSAKGSGNIVITIADQAVTLSPGNLPLIIKGVPVIQGEGSVESTTGTWQAGITTEKSKKNINISYGKNSLSVENHSLNLLVNGKAESTQIKVSLTLKNIHATGPDIAEINLPGTDLQVSLSQKKSHQTSLVGGKFDISIAKAEIKKESLILNGDIALSGNMKPQPLQKNKFPEIAGKLLVSNAKAHDQENSISINSIKGSIPWQKSMEYHEAGGEIKVSGITWQMKELGSFEAVLRLKGSMYSVDGSFAHSLPEGLVTAVNGETGVTDSKFLADMKLHMNETPFKPLNLGRFNTSMSHFLINGDLGLDGEFRYDANGLAGNLAVMMQNGKLENQEKKLSVNNINLTLLMPSLPAIRSAPAQKVLFDKATFGNFIFEKGKVIWQLESPDSIFIEEGVVRWVGGRVFTNAVRISPEIDELVVPIFCDRLILTEVLTQFGITEATGEGTVSGRIPLHIKRGDVRFEDGFLYSSPGQGGSIRVAAFDLLSAGIPKNSPQFAQVDFAAEALKNFQYNWARLLLNSEGDDLIMQMQMDGKPVQSLPFTYDSRTGLLQRADDTKKGINQPIRLDVNFRLPLNRFLGYGGKIQDMMKKVH